MTTRSAGEPSTSNEEPVLTHREGGVLRITLNRPAVGNALAPAQRDHIIAVLEEASADPEVRVVVLGANGRHFCTGADLSGTGSDAPPAIGAIARTLRTGSQRLIAAVLDCEKPVVASLHGAAAGIGVHLILACDFVVSADDARLIEVFVRRSLVPDGGGIYLLARLVGVARAKELMMLGDDLPATRALELGLVTSVVPPDTLAARTDELADRLARSPTRTLALMKALLNRSLESSREQCFADEAMAQEQNMMTSDAREGLLAFAERREPQFRGC